MLKYNLHALFQARGIERPHSFLVKSGFARETAHRLLNSHSVAFRLEQVERLCELLLCEPNDLLVWIPKKDVNYPEDFPLKKLQKEDFGQEWLDVVLKLPLDELKEVAKEVMRKKEEGGTES